MKITKQVLKKMIKEELGALSESTRPSQADVEAAAGRGGASVASYGDTRPGRAKSDSAASPGAPPEGDVPGGDPNMLNKLRDRNKAIGAALGRINNRAETVKALSDWLNDLVMADPKDIVVALRSMLKELTQ